jgi:adenine-specific DNA-methyltransferase
VVADKIKPVTPVRATTHPGDTRSNIPTAELESFARPEEKRPTIVRYPRNPDLDPHLLVICGFAFDPLAGEEASTLGRLTILQARMNPDLAMDDELLKKTGTGNLFMVFGEPDIDVRAAGDGALEVEIRGLDVYDPTTGDLRSSSVDDIAAWFLDTNYDGDAFFVRHAYFTGADDPYDKLRRALRADISDEAWATINSTVSRPFPRPRTGKVAVKVINHYGDEVMKVLGV